MPNARARSRALVNVVVSNDSAAGASNAPNKPCTARAVTGVSKLAAAPIDELAAVEHDERTSGCPASVSGTTRVNRESPDRDPGVRERRRLAHDRLELSEPGVCSTRATAVDCNIDGARV